MFRWTLEKQSQAVSMGKEGVFSNGEIAKRLGCSRQTIKTLFDAEGIVNDHTTSGRPISEEVESLIIDVYESAPHWPFEDIAELVGVSALTVKRAIYLHEEDEWAPPAPAAIDLAEIEAAMGGRRYEDHPDAAAEYAGQGLPARFRTIPIYDEPVGYRAPQMATIAQVSLAA